MLGTLGRRGLTAVLILALSACVDAGFGGAGTRALAVAGGAVIVTGPQGYCIDRGAVRDTSTGSFVLFGGCASLTGSRAAGQPARPAILTASVGRLSAGGADAAAALPAMERFFQSSAGRAALSLTGNADNVSIGSVSDSGATIYIQLSDSALPKDRAVEPTYWRAVTIIRGRIVTLSVLSPARAPLSVQEQRAVLDQFVARMRAANPAAAQA